MDFFVWLLLISLLFQVPYYQGELITFDVVPTKLTFSVNYKSVVLKVRTWAMVSFSARHWENWLAVGFLVFLANKYSSKRFCLPVKTRTHCTLLHKTLNETNFSKCTCKCVELWLFKIMHLLKARSPKQMFCMLANSVCLLEH